MIAADAEPSEAYFVRAPMYYTNFAVLEFPEGDYMIPFGSRPDLTGLENGKLYGADDVASVLKTSFGDVQINNGGAVVAKAESDNEDNGFEKITVAVALSVAVIVLIVYTVIRRRSAE